MRSNVKARQEGLKSVNEVTCGGNALPFYSAVRMRIARKGLLKSQEKVSNLGQFGSQIIKDLNYPYIK